MASGVSSRLQRLLRERKLIKATIHNPMIVKELQASRADLRDAQDSLKHRKFKWATIQGYYSMFHGARALLYSKGFRERSHRALFVAISELFANELGKDLVNQFDEAMQLREKADYGLTFSHGGAEATTEGAKRFFEKIEGILKVKRGGTE